MRRFLPTLLLLPVLILSACASGGNPPTTPIQTPPPLACIAKIQSRPLNKPNLVQTNPFFYIGYLASPKTGGDWSVCGVWTIRNVFCSVNNAVFPQWAGLLSAGGDIVQVGTKYRCHQKEWLFWYELGPNFVQLPGPGPKIGDKIVAWVSYHAATKTYKLGINALKRPITVTRDSTPASGGAVIEPDMLGNGQQALLANYGKVTITCILNGLPLFTYPVTHWAKTNAKGQPNSRENVIATDTFQSTFLTP